MRCWIELNRHALLSNYRLFVASAGRADVVPILKSNAYGHGLAATYSILSEANPPWIGLNYIYEAEELRRLGFRGRILIVGPIRPSDIAVAAKLDFDFILGSPELLSAWLGAGVKPRAHIKFDTGMARQGFFPKDAVAIATALLPHKNHVAGVCSHFANVEDVSDDQYAQAQLKEFDNVRKVFLQHGLQCLAHIAASSSALTISASQYDLVRVGISLYGLWPSRVTKLSYLQIYKHTMDLRPVLSWRTEIAAIKTIPTGSFVGYGCTFRAVHEMNLAILPVGYFEGYPRLAGSSNAYVLIRGQRCPIVGRICMNMLMVDVTHVKGVAVNDTVVLIGQDQSESLDPGHLAEWAHTINYEIVTQLNPMIPRVVQGSA